MRFNSLYLKNINLLSPLNINHFLKPNSESKRIESNKFESKHDFIKLKNNFLLKLN